MAEFAKFKLPNICRTHERALKFGESKTPDEIHVQFIHGTTYRILDIRVLDIDEKPVLTYFLEHPDAPGIGFGFDAQDFDINPKRTQRSRQFTPGIPVGSVYVGRPSQWGNPAGIGDWFDLEFIHDRNVAVLKFYNHCKKMASDDPEKFAKWLRPLVDRDLCCWCPIGEPCHADVLLALARHLKPVLCDPNFRTLIPASVQTWPEISCIIVVK